VHDTDRLRGEIRRLRTVTHPHVARLLDLRKSTSSFYLLLDSSAKRDLAQLLGNLGCMPEDTARRFMAQIVAGVAALHCKRVVCGSLRPQDMLLNGANEAPTLQVAYPGVACMSLKPEAKDSSMAWAYPYLAPEVWRSQPHTTRSDIWSVGAIWCELLVGKISGPPAAWPEPEVNASLADEVDVGSKQLSKGGRSLLRDLTARSPLERPTTKELYHHPYLQCLSTCQVAASAAAAGVASSLTLSSAAGSGEASCGLFAGLFPQRAATAARLLDCWCSAAGGKPYHKGFVANGARGLACAFGAVAVAACCRLRVPIPPTRQLFCMLSRALHRH